MNKIWLSWEVDIEFLGRETLATLHKLAGYLEGKAPEADAVSFTKAVQYRTYSA